MSGEIVGRQRARAHAELSVRWMMLLLEVEVLVEMSKLAAALAVVSWW